MKPFGSLLLAGYITMPCVFPFEPEMMATPSAGSFSLDSSCVNLSVKSIKRISFAESYFICMVKMLRIKENYTRIKEKG